MVKSDKDGRRGRRGDYAITAAALKAGREFVMRAESFQPQKPLTSEPFPAEEMQREDRER
jgi:hypothetical protein